MRRVALALAAIALAAACASALPQVPGALVAAFSPAEPSAVGGATTGILSGRASVGAQPTPPPADPSASPSPGSGAATPALVTPAQTSPTHSPSPRSASSPRPSASATPTRAPAPTSRPSAAPTAPPKPPSTPTSAGISALDPALAAYLARYGGRVGVQVYDVTHRAFYSSNAGRRYIAASSMKIEILVAFLHKLEAAHREPTTYELSLMTTMIENSNNDATSYLYRQIGDAAGMAAYLRGIGVGGITPRAVAWGWSTVSPAAQVRVLTLLHGGSLVNEEHTEYALTLLRHVEADQREGVGDTAPAGATVAMKVGYVNGPDGLMVMNSSGIVTYRGETWIVSVYTMDDASLAQGFDIANHVCGAIAAALT